MAETKHPPRKPNFFLWGGLVGLLLTAALFITAPLVIRCRKDPYLTYAVSNARQIGLALFEFEQSYGNIPNDDTVPLVISRTGTKEFFGSQSSTDYFHQLFAAGIVENEQIFSDDFSMYNKPRNGSLEKGECGFSYLIGSIKEAPPETPIVVTPLIPGKALFDYKAAKKHFGNRAIILRRDGCVIAPPIDPSGRVWINGKDLFDPTQPFWNGKPPIIKWPDL